MVSPPHFWGLTLLYHPDLDRIGAQVRWPNSQGEQLHLSRVEPLFRSARGGLASPLLEPYISRRPLILTSHEVGVSIRTGLERIPYEVNGRPGSSEESFNLGQLERGVVLTLGQRVTLMIHPLWRESTDDDLGLFGVSDAISAVRESITKVAGINTPVLLTGESGVGKELVARALHRLSPRSSRNFVAVNMATLPASTAAAQLFGYARGAFTGAVEARGGLFRDAAGGTLFLDEVGETPSEVQPMLLRAIESREIQPVGAPAQLSDVRILAATDANLERQTELGTFRRPLFYRLAATTIDVPPLRTRVVDIPLLFILFLGQALDEVDARHKLRRHGDTTPWLRRQDVLSLLHWKWSGNVRELRNVAYQMATHSHNQEMATLPRWLVDHLRTPLERADGDGGMSATSPETSAKPSQITAEQLRETLERHEWRIGPTAAALQISRNSVYTLMERFNLRHAGNLTPPDIQAAREETGSDEVETLATFLRVSPRGLRLRLRALGLEF